MNLPNKLTTLRMALVPVFLVLVYLPFPGHIFAALGVFILASLTDFLDGYLARKHNLVTTFGKFMDPLADKVLVLSALGWFVEVGVLPAWCYAIIVTRELAVTSLRIVAMGEGRALAAAWSGKIKTACTMVGICVILALMELTWLPAQVTHIVNWAVVILIVATTLYSGIEYFWKNRDVFRGGM